MLEAPAGIEPAVKVLQTSALPLGYVAVRDPRAFSFGSAAAHRGAPLTTLEPRIGGPEMAARAGPGARPAQSAAEPLTGTSICGATRSGGAPAGDARHASTPSRISPLATTMRPLRTSPAKTLPSKTATSGFTNA